MLARLGAEEPETITFPDVEGKNLHGFTISFPEAFTSRQYHMVIVAFEQRQQEEVDTWLPSLIQLEERNENFRVLELPTISKMNRLMRWIIYRGMRSGIEEASARGRTITLHIAKKPFKEALRIDSEQAVRLYLVRRDGVVLWQSQGPFNSKDFKEIKQKVAGRNGTLSAP
jgi:hypothetical protein